MDSAKGIYNRIRCKVGWVIMQKLEDVIKGQYGDNNEAGRQTGTSYIQIGRWINYGCLVDSKGVIWKPQGNLYKNREVVPEIKDNGGWISVEDRLPDEFADFLVFGGCFMETDYWNLDINEFAYRSDDVTHWMPLPELPEVVK